MITDLQAAGATSSGEDREAATQTAARARMRPVLTSILAIAALALPFVVLGARPGLEIVHPLAVVLLGGLVTTALVTLFGLPALYRHTPVRRDAAVGDEPGPADTANDTTGPTDPGPPAPSGDHRPGQVGATAVATEDRP